MYIRVHIYMNMCIHINTYICTYIYIYIFIHTYIYVYMHVHIYMYTSLYICMYIYIFTPRRTAQSSRTNTRNKHRLLRFFRISVTILSSIFNWQTKISIVSSIVIFCSKSTGSNVLECIHTILREFHIPMTIVL